MNQESQEPSKAAYVIRSLMIVQYNPMATIRFHSNKTSFTLLSRTLPSFLPLLTSTPHDVTAWPTHEGVMEWCRSQRWQEWHNWDPPHWGTCPLLGGHSAAKWHLCCALLQAPKCLQLLSGGNPSRSLRDGGGGHGQKKGGDSIDLHRSLESHHNDMLGIVQWVKAH
jgi:hypothetical protein